MTGLFQREAAEEPQFGDARLSRVKGGELIEGYIQIEHVNLARLAASGIFDERDASQPSRAFRHFPGAGAMWLATDEFVGRYAMGRLIKERIPDVQASRVNGLTTTADGALWLCTAFGGAGSVTRSNSTS